MKKFSAIISLLLIVGLIYYSFYSLMPSSGTPATIPATEFSTERALVPLKEISKAPHYLGSEEHERVRQYLVAQLESLGLEVQTQEAYVLQEDWQNLDRPKNIIAKIKGTETGKALLLLSHYDSAKVPSPGASDAGSGIVTILESFRAYLASEKTPKNDIIILFTDGEELGLDGAKLFVNEHPWAKNVGLALNFEARGSGGPSNMILETNQGNANLVKAFSEANPRYPVASSLMYSIYKMLPNDTDSTVFREDGDIDSFFFAFIDDHFDYHTANDNFENLDRNTLQHQGSYLLPLLHYFADADLSKLKAEEDYVYVNFPVVKMISYPFSWIVWMLLLAIVVFIVLLIYGISNGKVTGASVGKGFIALFLSLFVCGVLGYFGWELILAFYPHYLEIQHGFTYNGHMYIAFFVFLSLAILFFLYGRFGRKQRSAGLYVAPLLLWLLVNVLVCLYLQGAAYFIIPVFFGLVSFWLLLKQQTPSLLLLTLLSAPALFFFAPLIQFFPVGLGLEMLVISCVFTVLTFGLLVPVFSLYTQKRTLSILCAFISVGFFIGAHLNSDFSETRQKPNSLVYYQNEEDGKSYWVTYDTVLDDWTKGYLGDTPEEASKYIGNAAGSKYNTSYTYAATAPHKEIASFEILVKKDTLGGTERTVSFTLLPKRKVHQILLYVDTTRVFKKLVFNGKEVSKDSLGNVFSSRTNNGLIRYYIANNEPLEVTYVTEENEPVEFTALEYSFDLLEHPQFTINKRTKAMMPKPFVITDAIVVLRKFTVDSLPQTKNDSIISEERLLNE
ncbi:peptidase M28-like protein [Ulvibacter sp. MAR_2010_11]|uniref:M28 family peptidase n=1 Tax=Ulvibacter sp. MAR_2010_11 TaxID=1250229 RepID=UPI000C2BF2E1|nr:M28 family peptidase [Ulvibacter sp. MAR_2010_11]PKA82817.1 peptidase M28-like protein [Ulvibacter sp. MAR_2010_11]